MRQVSSRRVVVWEKVLQGTVKSEITGWRDEEISARHREYGFDCPACDVDFLLVEYHVGKPVALIEYKRAGAPLPNFDHPTIRAQRYLADNTQIPFLIVHYWPGTWAFRCYPVNQVAHQFFESAEALSEREYVQRLYRLRRLVLTSEISDTLNDTKPPEGSEHGESVRLQRAV